MQPKAPPAQTNRPAVRELADIIGQSEQGLQPLFSGLDQQAAAIRQRGQSQLAAEDANLNRVFGRIGQEAVDRRVKYSGFAPELQSRYTADVYAPKRLDILAQTEERVATLNQQRAQYRYDAFQQAQQLQEQDRGRRFQYDISQQQHLQASELQERGFTFEEAQREAQQQFLKAENQLGRDHEREMTVERQRFDKELQTLNQTFLSEQNELQRQLERSEGEESRQLQSRLSELERAQSDRHLNLQLSHNMRVAQLQANTDLRRAQISASQQANNGSQVVNSFSRALLQAKNQDKGSNYVHSDTYNSLFQAAVAAGGNAVELARQGDAFVNPGYASKYIGQQADSNRDTTASWLFNPPGG